MTIVPKILGVGLGVGFLLIVLDLYIKHISTYHSMTGTIPEPTVHPVFYIMWTFEALFILYIVVILIADKVIT